MGGIHYSWRDKLLRISILFSAFSNETGKQLYPSLSAEKKVPASNFKLSLFGLDIIYVVHCKFSCFNNYTCNVRNVFEDALLVAVACLTTTGPIVQIIGIEKHFFVDLQFFSNSTYFRYGFRTSRNIGCFIINNL